VLTGGEEISARAVVSAADPKRTFLGMMDAGHLTPDFLRKVRNYRSRGTVAKVHLALDALPDAPTRDNQGRPARIHIGPEIDYLERAFDASKYGEFSAHPYLDVCFPSLHEPSWAPQGKHVMSVHVQYAPYTLRSGDWNSRRNELAEVVMKTLAAHMPDLAGKVLHRHVVTPLDLEETYGLTGGHLRHGELSLDQLFTMRPVLGSARYRTPVRGLYLCGAGTHPASFSGQCGSNAAREIVKGLRK
jgi:phytoene dehydrogenase-like protein